jgi:NAD(P)-dependent dehydrogenase (short-subunit alcohol dehydrogenase family)
MGARNGRRTRQGLGDAFARQLAVEGMNLILADVLGDDLERRADELHSDFGIEIRTAACDLDESAPYDAPTSTRVPTAISCIDSAPRCAIVDVLPSSSSRRAWA